MNLNNKRILIIKPSSMGDVIHALPVAHAIKRVYPAATIGWLIQAGLESFLESDPSIDEIIKISIPSTSDPHARRNVHFLAAVATMRELRRLRTKFAANHYDFVIDLHASFRSGLISRTNPHGIRYGLADAKELNTYFQNELIDIDPRKPHAVDKNLACLSKFGIEPSPEDFSIKLSSDVKEAAKRFLTNLGLEEGKRIIYANPAARWITKMWNIDGWAKLTQMIADSLDATVIFGGGSSDRHYIDQILSRGNFNNAHNVAGLLKPVESAALIAECDVYVGVDSGPMHISAFLGLPVVALFGPTDPAKVGPYSNRSVILRNDKLDCLACRKKSCQHPRCMNEIEPETVVQSLKSLPVIQTPNRRVFKKNESSS